MGVLAEGVRNPTLFRKIRRYIDTELRSVQSRSGKTLDSQQAGAILAFIMGPPVLGAFAPRRTAGFAAPGLRKLVEKFREET